MSDKGPESTEPLLPTRAADEYEARFMSSKGVVLHREKAIAPLMWQLIFGSMVGIELVTMVVMLLAGMGPVALAICLPGAALFFLLWMLFAVLRVTVSTDVFHVQFGLFGPRVPIEAITEVESIRYDWKEYGGWGLKRSFKDGTAMYNMFGDEGRAVKVTYEDDKGKTRRVAVGSANADVIATALQRARSRVREQAPGVRAAQPTAVREGEVVEVERGGSERDRTSARD